MFQASLFGTTAMPLDPSAAKSYDWSLPAPHLGLEKAKQLRDQIAPYYDEVCSWAMPGRACINLLANSSLEVYDDTAVLGTPEFASRLQQTIMPNFGEWGALTAGLLIEDDDERKKVTRALLQVQRYVFKLLNASNFGLEVNEAFMDLALGTCALRLDKVGGTNPFMSRSVPIGAVSFLIGPDGAPDPIWEERCLPLNQLKLHYPDASPPKELPEVNGDGDIKLFEAWHRDWTVPNEPVYRQTVFMAATKEVVFEEVHRGFGARPIHIARWNKAGGQGWGRGPLFNCQSSIRKVNFAERKLLDHAEMQLAGIWSYEDDGVINVDNVRFETGVHVPRAPGTQAPQHIAPDVKMDIAQFVLSEARDTIRKALFTEQLGSPNQTPKSATEVTQRVLDTARAVGSPFARVIAEFSIPLLLRAIRILKDRGMIKLPDVDNRTLDLLASSPLAQSQRIAQLDATQQWVGGIIQMFGPERAMIIVDDTEYAEETRDLLGVNDKLLRSKPEQAKVVAQLMQLQNPGGANGEQPGGPPPAEQPPA